MIQSKKTVEEYVFEFINGVMLNQAPPDAEIILYSSFVKDPEPAFNDTSDSQSLRTMARMLRALFQSGNLVNLPAGNELPGSKGLQVTNKMKVYISPSFPNNLATPFDLEGFEDNQFLHVFFFLETEEIRNGDAVIVQHSIARRHIYVETQKTANELLQMYNLSNGFLWKFYLNLRFSPVYQNELGYPILYNQLKNVILW